MQVFVPYSDPKEVAKCLDNLRLHKQILEAKWIISCIEKYQEDGDIKILKHPVMKMYKDSLDWLKYYYVILNRYKFYRTEACWKGLTEPKRPLFLAYRPLLDCHKKRLYQKGLKDQARRNSPKNHYACFEEFNSEDAENIYIIDEYAHYYANGKLLYKIPLFRDGLQKDDYVDDIIFSQIEGIRPRKDKSKFLND